MNDETDNHEGRRSVRRTTVTLVLVAVAFYVAFIIAQIVRGQGGA